MSEVRRDWAYTTRVPAPSDSASPGVNRLQPSRSQTDVVVDGIKAMITQGTLAPGARLPIERELAADFAVSRGSLREGVRALVLMGVLETRQGDGTYVTSLDANLLLAPLGFVVDIQSPENSVHLQAVRRVLESEAVALAATRITDDQLEQAKTILDDIEELVDGDSAKHYERVMEADIAFHQVIARATDNPALEAMIAVLSSRTVRARVWRTMSERGVMRVAQTEHRSILAELVAHDGDRARIRMANHLLGVERFIDDQVGHGDDDFASGGLDEVAAG